MVGNDLKSAGQTRTNLKPSVSIFNEIMRGKEATTIEIGSRGRGYRKEGKARMKWKLRRGDVEL